MALSKAVDDYGYEILLDPLDGLAASEVLKRIVNSRERDELQAYMSGLELDLTPPNDERPFFFKQLPFYKPHQIFKEAIAKRPVGVVRGNLEAAATLLVILVVSALLVVVTIVIPLRRALENVGRSLVAGGTAYFFLLGFGLHDGRDRPSSTDERVPGASDLLAQRCIVQLDPHDGHRKHGV